MSAARGRCRSTNRTTRELTISRGAALLNARVAGEHAGVKLNVARLPPQGGEADQLATAKLAGAGVGDEALFVAIADRRTYRKAFVERAVSPTTVAQLVDAAAG